MMNEITVDTSIRRIVITEDEDLDLDKLLLCDNSGAKLAAAPASPQRALSPLSPSSPPHALTKNNAPASPTRTPPSPIQAREEEDEDEDGQYVTPAPAQPGDYLTNSLHKVPSKSILKKTSSYGNFETSIMPISKGGGSHGSGMAKKASSFLSFQHMDSSNSSTGSIGRGKVANSPLDSSLAGGVTKMASKSSYLSMDSSMSNTSQGSRSHQVAIGWDLDDTNSPLPSSPGLLVPGASLPAMPNLAPSNDDNNATKDADRAAGMDSSGSRHSGTSSTKIRRNVSFNSVNVREYDRIVGDNPGCRSGPPVSLDWSYSKKYEKNLDEYELERSTERVPNLRKLHLNKWKRRNMMAYQWGYTEEEMKAARKGTKKMQRQRSLTQMMLPLHMAEEAFVGLKNIISKKKSNKHGYAADWSDMSNSGSTYDTTQRRMERFGGMIHQDTIKRVDTMASSSVPSSGNEKLPASQTAQEAANATKLKSASEYQFTRRTF